MSKEHTPTQPLRLKIVEITDHPTEKREQIAFVQMPELCLDISCVKHPSMDRARFESRINYIVQAVNNHDRLVKALEWAMSALELDAQNDLLSSDGIEKFKKSRQLLTELKS